MSAEDILRKLADDPDLAIEIRNGTEHWRGGEITLTVRGSGDVEVLHRRSGQERRYSATFGPDRVARLSAKLVELGLTSPRAKPSVIGRDEGVTTLTLRRGDEVLHRVELAGGERHQDERLDGAMRLYEELVAEVTDGALPFGAAAAPL